MGETFHHSSGSTSCDFLTWIIEHVLTLVSSHAAHRKILVSGSNLAGPFTVFACSPYPYGGLFPVVPAFGTCVLG